MIRIDFDPAKITDASRRAEWEEWSSLARAATGKVITEWETWKLKHRAWTKNPVDPPPEFKPDWDEDVWKGLRDWLKTNVFHKKCAYCETRITGFPGDAEHFRPKGQVRVVPEQGKSEIVKIVDEDNDEIPHPGYFWLAYHWQNILPACEWCNRFAGKKDQFPVSKSHVGVKRLTVDEIDKLLHRITRSISDNNVYYLEPGDLDAYEGRLLLHPYHDNPEEHLSFQPDGTVAAWRGSKQGEASIRVFDLNHQDKIDTRHQDQEDGRKRYFNLLANTKEDLNELRTAAQKFKDEYYQDWRPYSVAVLDYIHFKLRGTSYDPDVLLGERRQGT